MRNFRRSFWDAARRTAVLLAVVSYMCFVVPGSVTMARIDDDWGGYSYSPPPAPPASSVSFTASFRLSRAEREESYSSGSEGSYSSSTSALGTSGGSTWGSSSSISSSSSSSSASSSSGSGSGWFGSLWNKAKSAVSSAVDTVKSTVSGTWTSVKSTVSDTWDSVKSTASNTWDSVKSTVSDTWDSVTTTASNTWNDVKETVTSTAKETWNTVSTVAKETAKQVTTVAKETWNRVTTVAKDVTEKVATVAKNTWDAAKPALATAWDWTKKAASNTASTVLEVATGASTDDWTHVGSWSAGKWAWVVGNTALTVAAFLFPPAAAGKFGTVGLKAASVVSKVGGVLKAPIAAGLAWIAPKVASLAPKVASLIPKAAELFPKVSAAASKVGGLLGGLAERAVSKAAPLFERLAPYAAKVSSWLRPVTEPIAGAARAVGSTVSRTVVSATSVLGRFAERITRNSTVRTVVSAVSDAAKTYVGGMVQTAKGWVAKDQGLRSFGNLLKLDPRNPLMSGLSAAARKLEPAVTKLVPAPVKRLVAKSSAVLSGLAQKVASSTLAKSTLVQTAKKYGVTVWHAAETIAKPALTPLASAAEIFLKGKAATSAWAKGALNAVITFRERKVVNDTYNFAKDPEKAVTGANPHVVKPVQAVTSAVKSAASFVSRAATSVVRTWFSGSVSRPGSNL